MCLTTVIALLVYQSHRRRTETSFSRTQQNSKYVTYGIHSEGKGVYTVPSASPDAPTFCIFSDKKTNFIIITRQLDGDTIDKLKSASRRWSYSPSKRAERIESVFALLPPHRVIAFMEARHGVTRDFVFFQIKDYKRSEMRTLFRPCAADYYYHIKLPALGDQKVTIKSRRGTDFETADMDDNVLSETSYGLHVSEALKDEALEQVVAVSLLRWMIRHKGPYA